MMMHNVLREFELEVSSGQGGLKAQQAAERFPEGMKN